MIEGFSTTPSKRLDLGAKNCAAVQREIMLLRPVGQIRVVVSSRIHGSRILSGQAESGSQVARASRGRRLVLGSETNCAPDNLHGRSILGAPTGDSQESCFAREQPRAALLSPGSEKASQTPPRRATTVCSRGKNWSLLLVFFVLPRPSRGNWVVPLTILINCSYNVSERRRLRLICVARVLLSFR